MYNDKRKYLVVAAILILVGFCLYFGYAFRSHEDTLVREMTHEKQQDVALLTEMIDKLVEMDKETGVYHGYDQMLMFAVEFIEANYHSTFAQVFDDELNPLTELNPGVGGGRKHNPLDYPEFIEAVRGSESGNLVYEYETAQAGKRDIYMTFRWVPTDTNYTSRYLIAVGISKYTISEQIDTVGAYGTAALITVAAFFILVSAVVIIKRGGG